MKKLNCKLKPVSGVAASKVSRYMVSPALERNITELELAKRYSEQLGVSITAAQYYIASLQDVIVNCLGEGRRVLTRLAVFSPVVTGTFKTVDADLSNARIAGRVTGTHFLGSALKDKLVAVNENSPAKVWLWDVCSEGELREGIIYPGVRIVATCDWIQINKDREDEGFFLVDNKDNVVAKARILRQDGAIIEFVFDNAPLGTFRLRYCTRRGKDLDYELFSRYYRNKVTVCPGQPPKRPKPKGCR